MNSKEDNSAMDLLHYATKIDSIRDLVNNFQLLQSEFHQTSKKEVLIERAFHFINQLVDWANFGFTWFDPQSGLFDLGEVLHTHDHATMEHLMDELIDSGCFASSLQLSRVASFESKGKNVILSPIRSGHEIKGVFVGITSEMIEVNREFEFHFINLAMNSLGAAIRRVESTDKLSSTNLDLGEMILKKVSESEEARLFAVATNQRITDFLALYHNEVYNSLNGVLGFAQLMMETVVSAEQRESMEFILKSGNHLKQITTESQKPQIVIDGVLSVDMRSVDIDRLWQNFIRITNEIFKEKQRTVIWKSHIPPSFHLTLDETRLRQVLHALTELISNVCPHTPLSISIRHHEFQDELIVYFESQELLKNHPKFDFTHYATLSEILKLNRHIEPLSFGMCRSIIKFEGWTLDLHEKEKEKVEIRLRINISGDQIMSNDDAGYILAIDDDPISLRLLQGALQKGGYQVITASHAKEAREKLIEKGFRQFSCAVSDYRMPEMTGLELSQWISSEDKTLACILLSAEADKQMISDSLRIGVFDFLEKPLVLNIVRNAVQKAVEQTKSRRNLQQSRDQVDEIQKFHHTILGLQHTAAIKQITFRFVPMHEVGGDFINIYPLPNNTFIVIATDVSGHDLKAAFVSAFFQGVTRGMIEKGASIREIYHFTNRFLIDEWGKETGGVAMSLSTCSAIIDLSNKSCELTSHGFPAPFYVTDQGKIRPMIQGGSPLGWFSDIDENEVQYPCQEGGAIYFWSDGLDDTANRMGISSFAALYRFLESVDGEKEIKEKAVDDLMVVRFEMTDEPKEGGWHPILFAENVGIDHHEIDTMQEQWHKSLRFLFPEMPEERTYDILLATREAYLNAMIHGAQKDTFLKAYLQICYCIERKKIRVRIDDPGTGHGLDLAEPMEILQTKLHDEHSGLTMIKFLCQEIKSERNGATVIMDFNLDITPAT